MEPTVEKSVKKKAALWIITAIVITSMVAILTLCLLLLNKDTIYPLVYIETVDVSNLTKQQAMEKIENIYGKELENIKINLVYEDFYQQLAYSDVGFTYLYDEAIEEAYSLGREGNIVKRIKDIYQLGKNPIYIELKPYYEEVLLESIVEDIEKNIYKEAKDATIRRQNGVFYITKEEVGTEVQKELLIEKIIEAIKSFSKEDIIIPTTTIMPKVTEEALKTIQEVISEFSTVFNPQMEGRSHNINKAANSINGTLVMPGEEFSFNKTTGPASASQGYQEAPVIIDGQLVTGVGGGVCQVSTTLYNAVVRGDLEVTSRKNHSLSVVYVPLGHDAAVAYNHLDFRFRNNFETPIYIESFVSGDRVHVKIYGKKRNNKIITLVSEVIEVIEPKIEIKKDPTMFVGEKRVEREAKKGYRVNTYKVYWENGRETKRQHISRDYYAAVDGIVIEGTKPKPRAETETTLEEDPLPQEEKENIESL